MWMLLLIACLMIDIFKINVELSKISMITSKRKCSSHCYCQNPISCHHTFHHALHRSLWPSPLLAYHPQSKFNQVKGLKGSTFTFQATPLSPIYKSTFTIMYRNDAIFKSHIVCIVCAIFSSLFPQVFIAFLVAYSTAHYGFIFLITWYLNYDSNYVKAQSFVQVQSSKMNWFVTYVELPRV